MLSVIQFEELSSTELNGNLIARANSWRFQSRLLVEKKGALKGLHIQVPPHAQERLITVVRGAIFDVVVDTNRDSRTFGTWSGFELSKEAGNALFVPSHFAHGFVVLEDETHVSIRVSSPFIPESAKTIRFDDPEVGIEWPALGVEPIVSERDLQGQSLTDFIAQN